MNTIAPAMFFNHSVLNISNMKLLALSLILINLLKTLNMKERLDDVLLLHQCSRFIYSAHLHCLTILEYV